MYRADVTAVLAGNATEIAADFDDQSSAAVVTALLTVVHQHYEQHRVTRVVLPKDPQHPYLAYLAPRDASANGKVVTADAREQSIVLADGGAGEFMQFLFDLHLSLASGKAGRVLVGIFGMGLLLMCITGLMLWWPGSRRLRGSLRVSRQRPPIVYYWQLHRATGAVGASMAIVTLVSGVLLAFSPQLRPLLQAAPPTPAGLAEVSPCEPGDFGERLDLARGQYPTSRIRDIRFANSGALQRVYFVNRTGVGVAAPHQVWLEPCRPNVAMVRNASQPASTATLVFDWLYPVHSGIALGRSGQLIILLSGIALMAMLITGGTLWYQRRRHLRKRRRRVQDQQAIV